MDPQPKRRWFRFRLSTILILTAIVAWGMATWPWWERIHSEGFVNAAPNEQPILPDGAVLVTRGHPFIPRKNVINFVHIQVRGEEECFWTRDITRRNPYFVYPALVLAAFFAWKAAWAVVERRRRKASAPE